MKKRYTAEYKVKVTILADSEAAAKSAALRANKRVLGVFRGPHEVLGKSTLNFKGEEKKT